MAGLADQQQPGIAGQSLIALSDLDRSVERRFPEPSLAFTHDMNLGVAL
jgi:hypothetical protein